MASAKQIAANTANAQLSSGPTSPQGKATCSHNALKTGLTGHTVILPTDDAEAYQRLIARFHKRWAPVGEEESDLVQSLADTEWRIFRIPGLESSVLALGRYQSATLFPEVQDPLQRAALIEGHVQVTYRRDLNNLALQETRLCRRRAKDTAQLEAFQCARKRDFKERLRTAACYLIDALEQGWDFPSGDFGSDFSTDDILKRAAQVRAENNFDTYPEVTCHQHLADLKKEHAETFGKETEAEAAA